MFEILRAIEQGDRIALGMDYGHPAWNAAMNALTSGNPMVPSPLKSAAGSAAWKAAMNALTSGNPTVPSPFMSAGQSGVAAVGMMALTVRLAPALKSPTVVSPVVGGVSVSNQKLYMVPQRTALPQTLWSSVCVDHVMEEPSLFDAQSVPSTFSSTGEW